MFGDLDKVVNTIGKMVETIEQLTRVNERLINTVQALTIRIEQLEKVISE